MTKLFFFQSSLFDKIRAGFLLAKKPSQFPQMFSQEKNWHKKSWAILQNINLWIINSKLYKKGHLELGTLSNLFFFVNLIIQKWSFAKLLTLSVYFSCKKVKGTFIKDVPLFCHFLRYLPTPVPFCPIFSYIPKIGHPTLANITTHPP